MPAPPIPAISTKPVSVAVDGWVNRRIRYERDDPARDEWAAPIETFNRGYGDCEDFAILKRAILRAQGIPSSWMYLILADDLVAREKHAMLLVYDDRWRMLDNRSDASLPVEKVKDYKPILALCNGMAWTFGKRR